MNGASKTYAMTGWRIGWGAAPAALIHAMTAVQSQTTSGPNAIAQAAVLAALEAKDQSFVSTARSVYARRAKAVTRGFNSIEGLQLLPPQGAFFAFVHCADLLGSQRPDGVRITSDKDVVDWLLDSEGVAAVDGASFGLSPYFRISIAASDLALEQAILRIARAVAGLRRAIPAATSAPLALEVPA